VPLWAGGPTWQLALFYVLAVGGTMISSVASRRALGLRSWVAGFLVGHLHAVYTWLTWPVLLRAAVRQHKHNQDWSRTVREPVEVEPEVAARATAAAR
jgi:hypothetical protein